MSMQPDTRTPTAPTAEVYHWTPRGYQRKIYHSNALNLAAILPRRAGKTDIACYRLCRLLLTSEHRLKLGVVAPTRVQAQDIEFERCVEFLSPLSDHPHIKVKYSDLVIENTRTGSRISFHGANKEHAQQLRGREFGGPSGTEGLGLLVIDELKDIPLEIVQSIILPCCSNTRCPILIIGTVSGRMDALTTLFSDWQIKEQEGDPDYRTILLTLDDTQHLNPKEVERIKASTADHIFRREYMSDIYAQPDSVLIGAKDIRDAAKRTVPYSIYSQYPIQIGYDVGIRRDRACVACLQGPKLHAVYELDTEDLNEQCEIVAQMCMRLGAAELYIDQTGPGEGPVRTLDTLLENQKTEVYGVLVGNAAQEKSRFHLVRSEILYRMSVWLKSADNPQDDFELHRQLGAILLDDPSDGRIKVAPKPRIREILGVSPDAVDAIALVFRNEFKLSAQTTFDKEDIERGLVKTSDFTTGQLVEMLSDDEPQDPNDYLDDFMDQMFDPDKRRKN